MRICKCGYNNRFNENEGCAYCGEIVIYDKRLILKLLDTHRRFATVYSESIDGDIMDLVVSNTREFEAELKRLGVFFRTGRGKLIYDPSGLGRDSEDWYHHYIRVC